MIKTALRTDVGRIRAINEDRAAIRTDLAGGAALALLADGMGGHQAGDIASQTTVDVVARELLKVRSDMSVREWEIAISGAIERANAEIFAQASIHPQLSGMGTTVVAALMAHNRLTIAHIGDSRAYLLHKGKLRLLTEDHSLVNELLRTGQISEREASVHPRRNVLTRALGTEKTVDPDIRHMEWHHGDQLLLCTDGLTNMVDEDDILHTLKEKNDLQWKADRLIAKALEAGGEDNVTVVLIEYNSPVKERREND